jgi:hypothetical protein
MVDSIQALVVDEDADDVIAVPERLRQPFARLGWLATWTTARNPAQARDLVAAPGAAYDLIVVVLPAGRADPAQEWLHAIRDAREQFPGAFILAIGDSDAHRPELLDEARRHGAQHALHRYEFGVDAREDSPAAIATEIHNHLLDTGAVHPIAVTYDEFDPDIQSLVHTVGESTLSRLYARILEAAGRTARNMSLSYIGTGYAGAVMCSVTAALDNTDVRTHHVLEISREKRDLAREAKRAAEAAELMRPALLARHAPAYPVGPVDGWYTLASQLEGSALTLRDWLARGASDAAVEDVLAALFTDGLGGVYADTALEIDSPAELLSTPYCRQRRIVHAIKELTPVLTHRDGCRLPGPAVDALAEQLTGFVVDGWIGGIDARTVSQRTYGAFAHGDLRATNVLVYEGRHPQPAVIDASGFRHAHWATDPSRLAVDLLTHSVDAGVASMFFTGFERWRDAAARLGRLEPLLDAVPGPQMPPQGAASMIPTSIALPMEEDSGAALGEPPDASAPAEGAAALAALTWLTGNLRAFFPGLTGEREYREHAWEWHAALARYLLRATYDPDVTVPKRALAVVAAHDQLAAAARMMPD